MKKWILGSLLTMLLGVLLYSWYRFRDRHPGYQIDIHHASAAAPFSAGFAKASINPLLSDIRQYTLTNPYPYVNILLSNLP